LAVCGLLLLAVGLVFGQTIDHGFVDYDDHLYVNKNPHVCGGLTPQGIVWAFTQSCEANWHPLTWISLMLDYQVYGLSAGGYHLTNVLLHAATAVLLFLVLQQMTGRFWPSALATALFAVHPLRVESVAWVTERKDVLCGLLFMLTLGAYLNYVRHPFSVARYLVVLVFFALGLMAKPMLVTLPLLLLLLDYWPLERTAVAARENTAVFGGRRLSRLSPSVRLVVEKIPLFVLAGLSCVLTVWAQGQAIMSVEYLPWGWRIGNAVVSYVDYLGQFFWPAGLAVFYPHPGVLLPIEKLVVAAVVLAGVSAGTLACWRRCPYLLVGWLWYLGMLVPVIGLLQAGSQAMADRYTYLPQIGLCLALAWAAADVCRPGPYRRWVGSGASTLLLVVLAGCAWRQTSFWRESETLWNHALACTTGNYLAHFSLGSILSGQHRSQEAMAHYRQATEINPNYAEAHTAIGVVSFNAGRPDEALDHLRTALQIKPNYALAHYNLGIVFAARGQLDEAMRQYRAALEIKSDDAGALYGLGLALQACGRVGEAITQFQQSVAIRADHAEAQYHLGLALQSQGEFDEAVAHYRKALELATRENKRALVDVLRSRISLYEAGKTHRQPASPPPRPEH
jgi:tetratricopeptide (TPR) repeat protein